MHTEQLQAFCLKLPAVTEDIKWGNDLVFSVGGKMFCVLALESPFRCSFKVRDHEFEELITQPYFIPAPYMARAKWVQVTDLNSVTSKAWEQFINQSYELVKTKLTKKVRQELGI
ncbi:MAG: MmcQ/YjbR family DNA-binding protein [Flavisolibacter sp.]|nr:MmcQ/YjbR family DNA-binding protein [Flavisolibacter sp.]